jgi:hypothetical protein
MPPAVVAPEKLAGLMPGLQGRTCSPFSLAGRNPQRDAISNRKSGIRNQRKLNKIKDGEQF